ncbi:uncharacterized protein V1518DRAFT_385180 [Limtongia smithiae]|uniref:uncharacterized protein n=1 Tax=Limtongia smithiae TaxID=1125753 RepID=UPI0034CF0CB1
MSTTATATDGHIVSGVDNPQIAETGLASDDEHLFLQDNTDELNAAVGGRKRKWNLGLVFLLLVVLLWVSSSFMVNSIFESDIYRKPYLVTYLSTATFSLYLVQPIMAGTLTLDDLLHPRRHGYAPVDSRAAEDLAARDSSESSAAAETAHTDDALSVRDTFFLSLQFCILWFGANWLANACLSYTTVASGTILACTSSFFTLLIGSVFGVEKFSARKLYAVAASILGIVLISTQDSASEDEQQSNLTAASIVVGDLMSLTSAAIYGLYTTLLKLKIGDESRVNMKIFFGFVGLCNTALLWPVLVILHVTGAERLEMPPTHFVWLIIVLNSAVTFFSDYLWIVTILLTSPLVVTMGLSGTIPLAVTGDIVLNNVHVTIWYLLGAILVGSAFFVINKDEEREYVGEVTAALERSLTETEESSNDSSVQV